MSDLTRRDVLTTGAAIVAAATLPATTIAAVTPTKTSASPSNKKGTHAMTTMTTKDRTKSYDTDWGNGQPMVFRHGWPLSADALRSACPPVGRRGDI